MNWMAQIFTFLRRFIGGTFIAAAVIWVILANFVRSVAAGGQMYDGFGRPLTLLPGWVGYVTGGLLGDSPGLWWMVGDYAGCLLCLAIGAACFGWLAEQW